MKIFGSKKATMTTAGAGLIPAVVTLVTIALSLALPDEMGGENKARVIESVATIISIALAAVLASYNIGQGMADNNGNNAG